MENNTKKFTEAKEVLEYIKKKGYKVNREAESAVEQSFRVFPQMLVKYEVDEMARVMEQSDYSDKVMLVQDNDDRVAVLLTENGSKGDELLYTVDHVVFALEASFDDLGYILDEVLGGHDERGYIRVKSEEQGRRCFLAKK